MPKVKVLLKFFPRTIIEDSDTVVYGPGQISKTSRYGLLCKFSTENWFADFRVLTTWLSKCFCLLLNILYERSSSLVAKVERFQTLAVKNVLSDNFCFGHFSKHKFQTIQAVIVPNYKFFEPCQQWDALSAHSI